VGTDDATWTWWFRQDPVGSTNELVWLENLPDSWGGTGYTFYQLTTDNNKVYVYVNGTQMFMNTWDPVFDQWYHMAVVRKDMGGGTDFYTLYIDGQPYGIGQAPTAGELIDGGDSIYMGARKFSTWGAPNSSMTGGLDDVWLYHEALTQEEVQGVMALRVMGDISITETNTTTIVSEQGVVDTYTVGISIQPELVVELEPVYNDSQIQITPEILTFTSSSFIPVSIDVSATNDLTLEGLQTYTVTYTGIGDSATHDFKYLGRTAQVVVYVVDNDVIDVSIIETGDSTDVDESNVAGTDTYQVILGSLPSSDVTVGVVTDGETVVNPTTLDFTLGKWSVPQIITVTVVNDGDSEGPHISTISNNLTGGNYEGVTKDVLANVTDDEAYCGDGTHEYWLMDVNEDCYVDMLDFAIFSESEWLKCSDPFYPGTCDIHPYN